MQHARHVTIMALGAFVALASPASLLAQRMEMKTGTGMPMTPKKEMKGMTEMKGMPGMEGPGYPTPDLLITTFERSVVVPDQAIPFAPLGMGRDFFGKLIAKVDFGQGVMFSVRKTRILPGGDVGIMNTVEICYIEEGVGLLVDGDGKLPARVVPAGSWFTVPTNWAHTLRNIGEIPLIMTVIRVGPPGIH